MTDSATQIVRVTWATEDWQPEELKKAVEVITTMAWWLGANPPGTPIPDWCYLSNPLDRDDLLSCWDQLQKEIQGQI